MLVIVYALGSLAFSYSEAFFSHQATAVLCFGAFYAAWRTQRGELKTWGWAVAGAFAGAAVMAEYTAALTVVAIAAWVAIWVLRSEGALDAKLKRLGLYAGLVLLGAAPFLGGLMAYHQACFGHPLVSGYKYLNDPSYQGWHVGGFLGIRLPDARAFVLSFFSPLRGFFMLSPFLLFALPGLRTMWKSDKVPRDLFWLTAILLLLNAYFTSSFTYDSWGWSTGPRHMTPLVPFLLLPVGVMLQALRGATSLDQRLGYGLGVGLLLSSIAVVSAVVFVNYVPESLSTSVFGLAVPLFEAGDLPPTVLNFFGWVNPIAGLVPFLLVAAVLVVLGMSLLPKALGRTARVAALAAAVTHVGLLAGATRHDAADEGAVAHLKSAWLSPAGVKPRFW